MKEFFVIHTLNLFQTIPTSSMPKELVLFLIIFGSFLIALSVLLKMYRRKTKNKIYKKYIREITAGLMIFGIIDIVLVIFRLESIFFFSMRLWWLVFWCAFIVWLIYKIIKIAEIKRRLNRAISEHQ